MKRTRGFRRSVRSKGVRAGLTPAPVLYPGTDAMTLWISKAYTAWTNHRWRCRRCAAEDYFAPDTKVLCETGKRRLREWRRRAAQNYTPEQRRKLT
jgi:hypothetical protein